MTHSVTSIKCEHCSESYFGVLDGFFQVGQEYATTCPKCSQQNFIRSNELVTGVIDGDIPDNTVQVMYVKVI